LLRRADIHLVKVRLLTVVWGSWHRERFLKVALRTLLAPGNLPGLCRSQQVTYIIHTTESDAQALEQSAIWSELCRLVHVQLVRSPDQAFSREPNPVHTHLRLWERHVARARELGEWIFVIHPDIFFADGFLSNLGELFERGAVAAYYLYLRVAQETFEPRMATLYPDAAPAAIRMTPAELLPLLLRHLHPWSASYLRGCSHFCFHAEYLLYPVPGEGFLMRVPSTHVLALSPSRVQLNSNFTPAASCPPSQIAILEDARSFLAVSVSPLAHSVGIYFRPAPADPDDIGGWWTQFFSPTHDPLSKARFRVVLENQGRSFERAAHASDFLVAQATVARNIHLVWKKLQQMKCLQAARCLAVAYFCARLRRRWRWRGPISILAPGDGAFQKAGTTLLSRLLAPGCEEALWKFIKAHILPIQVDQLGDRLQVRQASEADVRIHHTTHVSVRSLSGHEMHLCLEGSRLSVDGMELGVSAGVVTDSIRVYVIDSLMADDRVPRDSLAVDSSSAAVRPVHDGLRTPAPPTCAAPAVSCGNTDFPVDAPGPEKMPPTADENYEAAQKLRMWAAIREVMTHHAVSLGLSAGEIEPLRLVQERWGDRNLIGEAVGHLRQAILLDPAFAEAHFALGEIFYQRREMEAARRELELAMTLDPRPPGPEVGRKEQGLLEDARRIGEFARVLADQGYAQESESHLQIARTFRSAIGTPSHDVSFRAWAAFLCGRIHQSGNRTKLAIGCYGKASEWSVQFFRAHARLGQCLRQLGRIDDASHHLNEGMKYRSLYPRLPPLSMDPPLRPPVRETTCERSP